MSERGGGSWQQLRRAHEWLLPPTYRPDWETPGFTARILSMLGHVEVDWRASIWAAAPPVLTLVPSGGAHALLTGGRTRTLLEELTEALKEPEYCPTEPIEQEHAPSGWLIPFEDTAQVESLAGRLEIRYEYSVAERLSLLLPELDYSLDIAASTPPARGFGFTRLSPRTLYWDEATSDAEPGLYRYEAPGRPVFRLHYGHGVFYDVDLAVGTWAAVARWGENRLRYRPQSVNGELWVPVRAPLPGLHARAAALCSGIAPEKRKDVLVYLNVPETIARRIARSLDQTLQIIE